MKFYKPYAKRVRSVFENCESIINEFPPPYDTQGKAYLDKYNPEKQTQGNYICYLLPFWLEEPFELEEDTTEILAEACIFKLLYFMIQDGILDAKDPREQVKKLPLGNLCFVRIYKLYQKLFDSDSRFWRYFEDYMNSWAASMAFESKCDEEKKKELEKDTKPVLAQKAAPLKVAVYAAALIKQREGIVESAVSQVDQALTTLQWIDDWVDKYKDYEDGNLTPVLAEIMDFAKVDSMDSLERGDINRAAYFSNIPKQLYMLALDGKNYLEKDDGITIPGIVDFHEELEDTLAELVERTLKKREELVSGAFLSGLDI